MGATQHDRGLHAVARVRRVRERDSLIGLGLADGEYRDKARRYEDLEALMATHATADHAQAASLWATQRLAVNVVAGALGQAQDAVRSAELMRTAAQERWQRQHSEVRAVETLLDSRAEQRRAERDRAAARELDDLSGLRWSRAAAATAAAERTDGGQG